VATRQRLLVFIDLELYVRVQDEGRVAANPHVRTQHF
jgi:hypothetical protein